MSYDLSHLSRTETITVGDYQVTVREIPHGEFVALQDDLMGGIQLSSDRADIERQINSKVLHGAETADRKTLLGVQSWTLTDASGETVPVCLEAWRALPHWMTEQIEEAVDRLNPDIEEEFRREPGSNGTEPAQSQNPARAE